MLINGQKIYMKANNYTDDEMQQSCSLFDCLNLCSTNCNTYDILISSVVRSAERYDFNIK